MMLKQTRTIVVHRSEAVKKSKKDFFKKREYKKEGVKSGAYFNCSASRAARGIIFCMYTHLPTEARYQQSFWCHLEEDDLTIYKEDDLFGKIQLLNQVTQKRNFFLGVPLDLFITD